MIGDVLASLSLAKVLSIRHNLKFIVAPFRHSEIFKFDEIETKITPKIGSYKRVRIFSDVDITKYENSTEDILFWTDIRSKSGKVTTTELAELKKIVQPKQPVITNYIPNNMLTIAIHIRKGNGGGEFYDGEMISQQLFNSDPSAIAYSYNISMQPFEWYNYYQR